MKQFFIFLLLCPPAIIAQRSNVFKVSKTAAKTTRFATGWIALDSGWKFKAGDNPDWAKPGFNDSSWQTINLFQDLYALPQVPKKGIAWFRLRLITDSSMNRQLVMRIYQTGASEVYLDGKLIHQLGTVSTNADSVKYYNPGSKNLSLPLMYNAQQTLAIRFANLPIHYPVYFNSLKLNLQPWVTTLDNADEDYFSEYSKKFTERINIGIGVAIILCVLYLSFFLFFPAQKINLYFSLSNFFFALFLILQAVSINYHGAVTRFYIPMTACTVLYLLLFLYCIYKIFNQKFGWMYWSLLTAGLLSIPGALLIDGGVLNTSLGVFVLIDMLRVCIKSLKANKAGATIVLFFIALDLLYWVCNLLSGLSIIYILNIDTYVPFAFLAGPLSLAIYLGYAFGKTSQSLTQKLTEVEHLSDEKQQILFNQNETLERQVEERTSALNQSLANLKSAQAQLIQSEKMASLGELTAGIAHEIQNPLNFVNNFSEVNKELIEEIKNQKSKLKSEELDELLDDIAANEEKINHHGKRADAIVKGMLQHSRKGTGTKELTDINALCDEYLRLSYHGLRAKDKGFNADFKTDLDETIGKINIVPQDIGRVLLNLFNNAVYAVNEKTKNLSGLPDLTGLENYKPLVSVQTKRINNKIEIKVSDNGNGIPPNIIDKIFQPFFTTKPTGQGTGLGLSLSYDIIKAHGGEITVETKEGNGSKFIIMVPT